MLSAHGAYSSCQPWPSMSMLVRMFLGSRTLQACCRAGRCGIPDLGLLHRTGAFGCQGRCWHADVLHCHRYCALPQFCLTSVDALLGSHAPVLLFVSNCCIWHCLPVPVPPATQAALMWCLLAKHLMQYQLGVTYLLQASLWRSF